MPSTLAPSLRRALKTAIEEVVGNTPHDADQLASIRASFTAVLETTVPLPGGGVSDIAHRAALAAQLDVILTEIQHATGH